MFSKEAIENRIKNNFYIFGSNSNKEVSGNILKLNINNGEIKVRDSREFILTKNPGDGDKYNVILQYTEDDISGKIKKIYYNGTVSIRRAGDQSTLTGEFGYDLIDIKADFGELNINIFNKKYSDNIKKREVISIESLINDSLDISDGPDNEYTVRIIYGNNATYVTVYYGNIDWKKINTDITDNNCILYNSIFSENLSYKRESRIILSEHKNMTQMSYILKYDDLDQFLKHEMMEFEGSSVSHLEVKSEDGDIISYNTSASEKSLLVNDLTIYDVKQNANGEVYHDHYYIHNGNVYKDECNDIDLVEALEDEVISNIVTNEFMKYNINISEDNIENGDILLSCYEDNDGVRSIEVAFDKYISDDDNDNMNGTFVSNLTVRWSNNAVYTNYSCLAPKISETTIYSKNGSCYKILLLARSRYTYSPPESDEEKFRYSIDESLERFDGYSFGKTMGTIHMKDGDVKPNYHRYNSPEISFALLKNKDGELKCDSFNSLIYDKNDIIYIRDLYGNYVMTDIFKRMK